MLTLSQAMVVGGDGYAHPPPLSRLLSPQAGPGPAAVGQAFHFQMSPLLHPLVGQHILTVRQFSKEQVERAEAIKMLDICELLYILSCFFFFFLISALAPLQCCSHFAFAGSEGAEPGHPEGGSSLKASQQTRYFRIYLVIQVFDRMLE